MTCKQKGVEDHLLGGCNVNSWLLTSTTRNQRCGSYNHYDWITLHDITRYVAISLKCYQIALLPARCHYDLASLCNCVCYHFHPNVSLSGVCLLFHGGNVMITFSKCLLVEGFITVKVCALDLSKIKHVHVIGASYRKCSQISWQHGTYAVFIHTFKKYT